MGVSQNAVVAAKLLPKDAAGLEQILDDMLCGPMIDPQEIPPQFEAVRDADEEILWVGRPHLLPFLLQGAMFLVVGMAWGAMDYFGFIKNGFTKDTFSMIFIAVHLFPLWGSILNMIRLALVHQNTAYAITSKRVMFRTGFWGIDFKGIDYDQIKEFEINVNPIENLLGVGTLTAFSGATNEGKKVSNRFVGIPKPYEVFKMVKKVSVDIKTDWNYPNAKRPAINPGYNTSYKR